MTDPYAALERLPTPVRRALCGAAMEWCPMGTLRFYEGLRASHGEAEATRRTLRAIAAWDALHARIAAKKYMSVGHFSVEPAAT